MLHTFDYVTHASQYYRHIYVYIYIYSFTLCISYTWHGSLLYENSWLVAVLTMETWRGSSPALRSTRLMKGLPFLIPYHRAHLSRVVVFNNTWPRIAVRLGFMCKCKTFYVRTHTHTRILYVKCVFFLSFILRTGTYTCILYMNTCFATSNTIKLIVQNMYLMY